jgi:hypothetical protein
MVQKLKMIVNLGLSEYETLRRGLHSVHPSCRPLRARIGVGGLKRAATRSDNGRRTTTSWHGCDEAAQRKGQHCSLQRHGQGKQPHPTRGGILKQVRARLPSANGSTVAT